MIAPWILAARPKTLTAGIIPVILSATLVAKNGNPLNWGVLALILVSATAIQVATNYFNDAIDYQKGADTQARVGPVRWSGQLSPQVIQKGAIGAIAVALLTGIPLVVLGGLPILGVGVVGIILSYLYTGSRFSLAYMGIADIFVILFFGVVACAGTYFLLAQASGPDTNFVRGLREAAYWGLGIGLLANNLMAINNFRDQPEDRKVGKRTLAVRWGLAFARRHVIFNLISVLLITLGAAVLSSVWFFVPMSILAVSSLFFLRKWLVVKPSPECNQLLAMAAGMHALWGASAAWAIWMS